MNEERYHQNNIMIVDDDPDIVFSLKMLFEREGFKVTNAYNGRHCLIQLEKGFQGIILLDLMMPVLNGIETIKKMTVDGFIQQNTVIVLTAKRIQGEEFNEIYSYIAEYITKPFDINTLVQTVKRIAKKPPMKRI
ncbi:hypothetical protein AYK25_01275 [Thermoplasmatales archaeon SM1-50]|nr:MAG: hypothetical protein AYK25_01275 [Thermoplasmatales archaeon SM1-50]